jgi:hypothetical protein
LSLGYKLSVHSHDIAIIVEQEFGSSDAICGGSALIVGVPATTWVASF